MVVGFFRTYGILFVSNVSLLVLGLIFSPFIYSDVHESLNTNYIGGNELSIEHPLILSKLVPEDRVVETLELLRTLDGIVAGGDGYDRTQASFGFSKKTALVRINISAREDAIGNRYVLYIDYPLLDSVKVYTEAPKGVQLLYTTGDSLPYTSRPLAHRAFAFPIKIEPGHAQVFYIKAYSRDTLQIPIKIFEASEFEKRSQFEQHILGLFFGAVLMMAVFISCLYIILKDRATISMAIFLICVAGIAGSINGVIGQWIFPDSPNLTKELRILWLGLGMSSTVVFAMEFLNTKLYMPNFHRVYRILGSVCFFLPILIFVLPFYYTIQISLVFCFIISIMVVVSSVIMLTKKYPPAKFYFIAWVWFVLGAMTIIARAFSIIPNNFWTEYGFQLGSLICFLSLALGIASKFNMERTNGLRLEKIAGEEKERRLRIEENSRISLEEKVMERTHELSVAKKEAEDAIEAKSHFLAAASHDLRQPLHAACLIGALIEKKVKNPEDKEIAASLNQSLTSLSDLFSSLLDVSRLDAGILDVNLQPIILSDIFDALSSELSESLQQEGIQLTVRCQALVVESDPVLLIRILRNLMMNVITHADADRVLLIGKKYGDETRIILMDNGCGLEDGEVDNIFKEFYRTKTKKSAGLGLGLTIVKRLCLLLKHGISTSAAPSKGMSFIITLPLLTKIKNDFRTEALTYQATNNERHKIMVIDDDVIILEAMGRLFTEVGYQIRLASSVEDAKVTLAGNFKPDIIISDYHLDEEKNGLDALEELSCMLTYPVKKLILTGETGPNTLEEIKKSGVSCLHKPVDVNKLMLVIDALLT